MEVNLQKLGEWIDKRDAAMIASVDEDGFPTVKAMLIPRKRDGLKTLYFSTNTSSQRVAQYRAEPKACVYYYEKGKLHYQGLMLQGIMEVLEDDASKRMIWQVGDRMYYPKGVTDPDYCVLRFTAAKGRLYRDMQHQSFEL